MDPRYKRHLFTTYPDLFSDDWVSDCHAAFEECFEEHYAATDTGAPSAATSTTSRSSSINPADEDWDDIIPSAATMEVLNEIEIYLQEARVAANPMDWWRVRVAFIPSFLAADLGL